MSVRTDVTIDFLSSPRIATIAAPSTTISVQDLVDTLRNFEQNLVYLQYDPLLADTTSGKVQLDATKLTGITCVLSDCRVAFEARGGPTYTQCSVTSGNLASVDTAGLLTDRIEPTAFTQVVVELDTSAALVHNDALTVGQFIGLKDS